MKANVGESPYVLTVSMIVKNEEKHLAECLDALQPLLKGVKSELLITDTGSDDKTVEIASRYTDKIFHFKWVNDFSAARNFGLEKAQGEWFMFLDADDVFTDLSEMIRFFNDKRLNRKYNTCTYMTRNYTDAAKTDYNEFMQTRIFRVQPGIKFSGRVHEAFGATPPVYNFSTYDYHTGYIFTSYEDEAAKSRRNMNLLHMDLEDNPHDLRNWDLAIRNELDGKLKAANVKRAEEEIKIAPENHAYLPMLYHCLLNYYQTHDHRKAITLTDEFLEKFKQDDVMIVDIYGARVYLFNAIKDFKTSCEAYEQYSKFFDMHQKGELKVDSLRFINPIYLKANAVSTLKDIAVFSYMQVGEFAKAFAVWESTGALTQPVKNFKESLNALRGMIKDSGNFDNLALVYSKVLAGGEKERIDAIEEMIEKLFYGVKNKYRFADLFTSKADRDVRFFKLLRLYKQKDTVSTTFRDEIQSFIDDTAHWSRYFSEALYMAIERGADLKTYIAASNSEIISRQLSRCAEFHSDYAALILERGQPEEFTGSVKELYWLVTALEKASYVPGELPQDKRPELYERFCWLLAVYVTNIYNPELLNETDLGVMPALHRFGYRMSLAYNARESGKMAEYVRGMREALKESDNMKEIISGLLRLV
jgi:glycosyltransferase involved in cell wall biosynthesis